MHVGERPRGSLTGGRPLTGERGGGGGCDGGGSSDGSGCFGRLSQF